MDQRFFHLASIRFYHEYAGEGLFDGLSVAWSRESALRLGNLQLLLKPFVGGVHILGTDPGLLEREDGPILLRISLADRLFYNYTDLGQEIRPGAQLLFFSNQKTDTSGGSLGREESASAADTLTVVSQAVIKVLLAQLGAGEVLLLDESGNRLPQMDFRRFFGKKGESVFYTVDQSGKRKGFYKPASAMERTPFGLLAVMPDSLCRAYRTLGNTVPYQVRFRTRRTFWKYILSDRTLDKFSRLSVIDAQNKEIRFKEGEFEIQPEWKVRSFESEVEIPLSAESNVRFQLIDRAIDDRQAGKVVCKQLPKASPEQLYQLPTDKQFSYSHIFI